MPRFHLSRHQFRVRSCSWAEKQDDVDEKVHEVNGPRQNGRARSGGRECAEHQRESEKGHVGQVESEDHGPACYEAPCLSTRAHTAFAGDKSNI